jgi:hypothetical protein
MDLQRSPVAMFVRKVTRFSPVLSRGVLTDGLSVGAIVVEVEIDLLGTMQPVPASMPGRLDPPPDHTRRPLWRGTSVTIAGDIVAPPRAPYVRRVDVRIGDHVRSVVVFGERRWLSGAERATEPAPFDVVPLDTSRAYGGVFELPPGPEPGTGLPHPGGLVAYPLNPTGKGFYPDASRASGQPLPQVEWLDQRVRSWRDRPVPAVLGPCPDLPGLRLSVELIEKWRENPYAMALRLQHHATASMIFDDLRPGVDLALRGMGRPIQLRVPEGPVVVTAGSDARAVALPERVRSVHLDARRQIARLTYEYSFQRRSGEAPMLLHVRDRGEGVS